MNPESPLEPEMSTPTAAEEPFAVHHGYSLATMLLAVTMISLICGASVLMPGLGLMIALVSVPAAARTVLIRRHTPSATAGNSFLDKLAVFLSSIGFIAVFGVAVGGCCFGTCFPAVFLGMFVGQFWEQGDYPGIATGFVTGFGTGGLVAVTLGYLAITRIGLPFHSSRISRSEKVLVAISVLLAVVCGFILFFWFS